MKLNPESLRLREMLDRINLVSRQGELKAGLSMLREETKPDGSKVLRFVRLNRYRTK